MIHHILLHVHNAIHKAHTLYYHYFILVILDYILHVFYTLLIVLLKLIDGTNAVVALKKEHVM